MKSAKPSTVVFNLADGDWNHPLKTAREMGRTVAVVFGAFELLHTEHVKLLEAARCLADWILVGIESDRAIQTRCGERRPLVSEAERAELVAGFEAVDAVVLLPGDTSLSDLLHKVRPDWVVMKRGSQEPTMPAGCQLHWVDLEADKTNALIAAMVQ